MQQLLQTGKARADVGFVRQQWIHGMSKNAGIGNDNGVMNWNLAHQGISYRSTQLQDNGYTYDYFSPKFLFDDDVHFDTRTKTIEKAGYKAIVLYQDWLDIEGAKRILAWAKQGLKVVVLEDAASRTPFNDGKSGALKKVMDELKTLPTVRQATVYDDFDYFSNAPGGYDDNVMEKLQELGVQPYTGFSEENLQLLTQTRQDDAGNQYTYVYNFDDGSYHANSLKPSVRNAGTGPHASTDLVKPGTFVPYSIDPWTGNVTELADYRWEDGKTIVPIELDYNNIALLAFEKADESRLHVVSTNADSAFATQDGVAVRTTRSGRVTAALSNGEDVSEQVEVPQPYDIRDWDLTVQKWTPNPVAGNLVRTESVDGVTTTNKKTSTVTTPIDVSLDTLKTWDQIPEVGRNVSGTGHYEATFDWDADAASGAYVDLGDGFVESMEVWVNGHKVGGHVSTNPTKVRRDVGGVGKPTIDDGTGTQVPLVGDDLYTGGVSWTDPVADISGLLVDGENEIVIDYASSLSNLQLSRGIGTVTPHYRNWWNLKVDYFAFGPQQAKIVPFVDVEYTGEDEPTVPPTSSPTPTPTPSPTATPTPTPPAVEPTVRVKRTVRAGKVLKVRGRDVAAAKVRITLGGRKLAVVKVVDGRFVARKVVPENLSGRKVLRVLDRKGEVLFRTTLRIKRAAG
ncbi:hypothetical protein KDN32_18810 [Nocardioides sp. J2M5]|uniref:hypothetical protein n=1 Tax=Nocardioides palaemonis TaxID=2829810 RepID=UPI001BACEBE8|nr:hypothetical protein [Nocardioides palaemonis]MBS2939798.1 hypothetical protein [Nocardioides palaemonis]